MNEDKSKVAFITRITGQDGSYLSELLLGDSFKGRNKLGWKPECDNLDKLIDSMLGNYS